MSMPRIAKPAARVFAVVFLLLFLLPQLDNPLIGPAGYLRSNFGQDCMHLAFAAILVLSSLGGETRAATGLYLVAILCIAFAGLGYLQADRYGIANLFDLIRVNLAGVVFHALTGVALFIAGCMNTARYQVIRE